MTPKFICLHWSAGSYSYVSPRYHRTWDGAGNEYIQHRDSQALTNHTGGHNTDTLGYACACMAGGQPLGPWPNPPLPVQVEAMCFGAALSAIRNNIPLDRAHIFTHAEIANELGYGLGSGHPETRWDFTALTLKGMAKRQGGLELRNKIRWYYWKLTGRHWQGRRD